MKLRDHLWLVAIVLLLAGIFYQWVRLNYDDCTIDHRSGSQILDNRNAIKKACKDRLNPFF